MNLGVSQLQNDGDKDLELYLTLKFNTIDHATMAFKKAIHEPPGFLIKNPTVNEYVVTGIRKWVEQGCPDKLDIASDDTELFLIIKFGSLAAAHQWWVSTPPGTGHGLRDAELEMILDYIPDARED